MVTSPNVNLSDLKRRFTQARIEKGQGDSKLLASPIVDAGAIQHAIVRHSTGFSEQQLTQIPLHF